MLGAQKIVIARFDLPKTDSEKRLEMQNLAWAIDITDCILQNEKKNFWETSANF